MCLHRLAKLCFLLITAATGARAQTTLDLSTDLITLGIASANMVPNQSTLDSGPLLESGVKYAATHHYTSVIANTGSYYFLSGSALSSGTHVLLNGFTGPLTVDLQGSDLYFSIRKSRACLSRA